MKTIKRHTMGKRSKRDSCIYYKGHKVESLKGPYGYCWKVYDLNTGEHLFPVATPWEAQKQIDERNQ